MSPSLYRLFSRSLPLAALLAFLLVFARPTPASLAAGIVFVILGESLRFWAAGHLLKTRELITGGPYRHTRNPLYLGRLLIFTGLALMANLPQGGSWIVLVLGWAVFFGIYLPRKERTEPPRLLKLHGEAYQSYFDAVPALFPTLRPYPDASAERWSGARIARNREIWMVVGLLAVVVFLAWRAASAIG